jgi:1-pyrroline-5-carboxylate dehydrogenase
VRPTVVESSDPTDEMFATEYFGPILAVHVYPDAAVRRGARPDGPSRPTPSPARSSRATGAVIADALHRLRFAAGNFYINDKPTGAVVGQQPFGGGRASGTNDKAGSAANLLRWTSVRSIKENFVPPTEHAYPHMG